MNMSFRLGRLAQVILSLGEWIRATTLFWLINIYLSRRSTVENVHTRKKIINILLKFRLCLCTELKWMPFEFCAILYTSYTLSRMNSYFAIFRNIFHIQLEYSNYSFRAAFLLNRWINFRFRWIKEILRFEEALCVCIFISKIHKNFVLCKWLA